MHPFLSFRSLFLIPVMRSLQWAQATADIADRMIQRAVSKIVDNAHPAVCEEAKTDIGKQVASTSTQHPCILSNQYPYRSAFAACSSQA